MSKNNYLDGSGDQIFIPCINWIPGLVVDEIRKSADIRSLFEEYSGSDKIRKQRQNEWREILVILYPNWNDYQEGFEGLGSLFGGENNE
jgi:hypothetical protein